MNTAHIKIRVSGKVQGVYFRAFTLQKANELGIKGYVKNEPDGSVYIEAQADETTLKDFVAWCYQGSPLSRVERVESEPAEGQSYSDFKIVR